MKFIDKDAVVAEIERLKKEDGNPYFPSETADKYYARGVHFTCHVLINFLNTIEAKEVDLEREMQAFAKMELEPLEIHDANIGISITMSQLYSCARRFFKLGMQQSNNDNNNEEKS